MVQIGTYSKKKEPFGISITVVIPNARKVGRKRYPYKSKYLTGDIDDIMKDIKKTLEISGQVKFVPTTVRSGKIVVGE